MKKTIIFLLITLVMCGSAFSQSKTTESTDKEFKFVCSPHNFDLKSSTVPGCINIPAKVDNLILGTTEIVVYDDKNKSYLNINGEISVTTLASDPENDILIYNYTVSGGTIVGKGKDVIWDLSDAKPGKYTVTAGVDDGCGLCGETKTQTVVVK